MNKPGQRVISVRVKLNVLGALEEAAFHRRQPVSTLAAEILRNWCISNGLIKREGNQVSGS